MLTMYLATGLIGDGSAEADTTLNLALAKQHLRVRHDDEDALIQQYLNAAIALVEKMSGNLLTRRAVTQRFASFGCYLPLDWAPNPSNVSIAYIDAEDADQTISDGRIVRDRVYPASAWPTISRSTAIEISYTAGWVEPPSDLVSAVLLLVGHMYQNREAVSEKAMAEVPLAVDALVQPYRRVFV